MKKFAIILFLLTLGFKFTFSQYSIFEHYGVEDGLQSSEIYSQAQDNNGYMWFATSKGVSRFDGFDFKNFTMKDGLPSNSIIEIYVDYKGRIWFSSYEGALCYYENQKIVQHPLNDTIKSLSKNYFIDNICVDTLDNLWFSPSAGGIYKIETNGSIYFDFPKENKGYSFFFKEMDNGFIWNELDISKNNLDSIKLDVINDVYYLKFTNDFKKGLRRYFFKVSQNEYLVSFSEHLLYIKDKKIVKNLSFENDISGIFCDNDRNFWISVMYEGVYLYENGDLESKPEILLRGKSPISVFQDREGNYWFATTEDGIYFTSSFQFNTYYQFGFSDYNILAMSNSNNDLYFSTYDKQVFKCNVESTKISYIQNLSLTKKLNSAILDIACDRKNNIWFLGSELIKLSDDKTTIIDTLTRAYGLYATNSNEILATYLNGFKKYSDNKIINYYVSDKISSSNSIFEDSDGTIYLGSLSGLYALKNSRIKYFGEINDLLKSRVNDIAKIEDYLIIATSGEGLILLKDTTLIQINKSNYLTSNFVNTIFVDNDTTCWLGTNKGLCKVVFDFSSLEISYKIEKFTRSDGLYSEDIKSIVRINDCIWLGTSKGLISFIPENLKKQNTPPNLLLDSVLVNDKKTSDFENKFLKYNQNNISFFFKAISYRANQKIVYRYKLEGFDEQWVETGNRYVRFPNLPDGNYSFYLTASSEDKNWNETPLIIKFSIKKHFTKTVVFLIFVILFIGTIISLVLTFIYKNLRKDIENKRLLLNAEQKALRSQMNPHFIFNSLNSIRRYILENDNETADGYLTNFASLMRLVLENSKQNFIPLSTEIETLKRYMELEKMRFDNSFTFKINSDKNLLTNEIKIPPMLIQPYLENAIWHGLAPKKSDGLLQLNFENTVESLIICTIEDNGIGREKALETSRKRNNHTSTGLKNIEERIELINTITNSKIEIKIIDLYDDNHNSTGTKVVIKIPYKAFN